MLLKLQKYYNFNKIACISDQIYGIRILQRGKKIAEKMKSQLVVRKYIQELAIPSVL